MGKTVLQSLDSGNKHNQEVEVVVQFKKKTIQGYAPSKWKTTKFKPFENL